MLVASDQKLITGLRRLHHWHSDEGSDVSDEITRLESRCSTGLCPPILVASSVKYGVWACVYLFDSRGDHCSQLSLLVLLLAVSAWAHLKRLGGLGEP